MSVVRHELNESEASFLWATARFGGGEALVSLIQPQTQELLRPKIAALAKLDESERAELLEQWACADALSREAYAKTGWMTGDLWQEAPDFSIQKLSLLQAKELPARMLRIGLFQFSVVARAQDRRQMIRTRRELGDGLMGVLDYYLSMDRAINPAEEVRIREVMIVLSRRYAAMDQRLAHLGMYFVACAAGTRFRRQVTKVSELLGGELGRVFLWYYHGSLKSSRDDLDRIARLGLESLSQVRVREGGQ